MKISYLFIAIGFLLIFSGCRYGRSTSEDLSKPNILLILVDDLGYSDLGCFGSEIRTPAIDNLAAEGVQVTDFYVSPLCAPTRAMLMTGVDNHQNGFGMMPPGHTENQYLKEGYEGFLPNSVIALPEILRQNGYHTYMAGKWHLGHHLENYPVNRGFEKSFAFLGGGSGHFSNAFSLSSYEAPISFYVRDADSVTSLPEDFYSSKNFADEMINFIRDQKDDAPFFGYLAFTAPHDPLHVPDDYLDRYKGRYDSGYNQIRKERLSSMKEMGIVDETVPLNPGTGVFHTWNELDANEQITQARKMEIYAAMVENLDDNISRVLDALKDAGKYENTIIIFLSDNGANPKEAIFYPGNTDEILAENFDNSLDNMGKRNSFVSQGGGWAEVSSTPFSYFKTTTGEGGIHAPLIISGPAVEIEGIQGETGMHVCDIVPTILEIVDISYPDQYQGVKLSPLYGTSGADFLSGESKLVRDTEVDPLHFEMVETRAIVRGDWKALMLQPPYFQEPVWKLYNLSTDPLEKNDLALERPDLLKELVEEWNKYAERVGYIQAEGPPLLIKVTPEEFYSYQ